MKPGTEYITVVEGNADIGTRITLPLFFSAG